MGAVGRLEGRGPPSPRNRSGPLGEESSVDREAAPGIELNDGPRLDRQLNALRYCDFACDPMDIGTDHFRSVHHRCPCSARHHHEGGQEW